MQSSSASKTWPRTKKMLSSYSCMLHRTPTFEASCIVHSPPRLYHSCVQSSRRRTFLGLPGPHFAASGIFVGGEGRCVNVYRGVSTTNIKIAAWLFFVVTNRSIFVQHFRWQTALIHSNTPRGYLIFFLFSPER